MKSVSARKVIPKGTIVNLATASEQQAPLALRKLVIAAWEIDQQLADLNDRLKVIKDQLKDELGPHIKVVLDDVCEVRIDESTSVSFTDFAKLREILGPRYEDLVSEKVSYSPTDVLKDMFWDADHALNPALREIAKVTASMRVTIKSPSKKK